MGKTKVSKILSIFLSFLLVFQQAGLAQVASSIDLSGKLAALRQSFTPEARFRPLHLRYLSYDSINNNFKLLVDKGTLANPKTSELESASKDLLKYFFIGLALPNDTFWVNLRPDSPDEVIDPLLAQTDIGRIFLEADVELKKDTALATSPDTKEGKVYWDKLYKKAEELYGTNEVTIPTLTRPWIVPDEVIISESKTSAYIYKATLKVMLEEDYLKSTSAPGTRAQVASLYKFDDERAKELNEYSTQLLKELIIPKLTQSINTSKKYASLRQVYYSLILAQWFKAKFRSTSAQGAGAQVNAYNDLINSKDLSNLTSEIPCNKDAYFKQYQKSFQNGEYKFDVPQSTPQGQSIRSYFSGGAQLGEAFKVAVEVPTNRNSSSILGKAGMFLLPLVAFIGVNIANPAELNIRAREFRPPPLSPSQEIGVKPGTKAALPAQKAIQKAYDFVQKWPLYKVRDGEANLFFKDLPDGRRVAVISAMHGSQAALELSYGYLNRETGREFDPREWLFIIEGGNAGDWKHIELGFLDQVAQNLGASITNCIVDPYRTNVLEAAAVDLKIDLDEVYSQAINQFIKEGFDRESVIKLFAKERGISYEDMLVIWAKRIMDKKYKGEEGNRRLREISKVVSKKLLEISNKLSEPLVKGQVGNQKHILFYVGAAHLPVVHNIFGTNGWQEYITDKTNIVSRAKEEKPAPKDKVKLQKARSLISGARGVSFYSEELYQAFGAKDSVSSVCGRETGLEIIEVKNSGEDEVWIKVKVTIPSDIGNYGLPPAKKGDTGWMKVTSDPKMTFIFIEQKAEEEISAPKDKTQEVRPLLLTPGYERSLNSATNSLLAQKVVREVYDSVQSGLLYRERDGEANLFFKDLPDGRQVIAISAEHGSQSALDLSYSFFAEQFGIGFDPREWLFFLESGAGTNKHSRFVELVFLSKVAQGLGVPASECIVDPVGNAVLEAAARELEIDLDEAYYHVINRFIADGEDQRGSIEYFSKERGITYEKMLAIWKQKIQDDSKKYTSEEGKKKFKEINKRTFKMLIDISNRLSESLVRGQIAGQKHILFCVGMKHLPVVHSLFGTDGWQEFKLDGTNRTSKAEETIPPPEGNGNVREALSLVPGMLARVFSSEELYPSVQAEKPVSLIYEWWNQLEVISVKKISDDEAWVNVRVIACTRKARSDIPLAKKGDIGWMKVTSDPNDKFGIEERNPGTINISKEAEVQEALSLVPGKKIVGINIEVIYPELGTNIPVSSVRGRETRLEVIRVKKIREDEAWIKVKVIEASDTDRGDFGYPSAKKGDIGWIKTTSEPENCFLFFEEDASSSVNKEKRTSPASPSSLNVPGTNDIYPVPALEEELARVREKAKRDLGRDPTKEELDALWQVYIGKKPRPRKGKKPKDSQSDSGGAAAVAATPSAERQEMPPEESAGRLSDNKVFRVFNQLKDACQIELQEARRCVEAGDMAGTDQSMDKIYWLIRALENDADLSLIRKSAGDSLLSIVATVRIVIVMRENAEPKTIILQSLDRMNNNLNELAKLNDAGRLSEWVAAKIGGVSGNLDVSLVLGDAGAVPIAPSASQQEPTSSVLETKGGIDFRSMPIVTRAMMNLSAGAAGISMSQLKRVDLDKEWSDIEQMVSSGITPSGERIKEYLQASSAKGNLDNDIDKVLTCISEVFRLEEDKGSSTDEVLRDVLVVLEASRSSAELTEVLVGAQVS